MATTQIFKLSLIKAVLFFIGLATLSSCVVGKKKYEALLKQHNTLDSTLNNLLGQHKALNERTSVLLNDTATLGKLKRALQKDLRKADLDYNALLKNSSKETQDLSKRNALLGQDLAAREKRVQELESLIADKEKATRELRDRVAKSLLGFNEKDLTIKVKNGKVYVSLSEQLLFASGKYDVDPKGEVALKTLASVLKKDTSVNITIEGHTDDVPMKSGTSGLKDNWDLSVLRATSIARLLTSEGVLGKQVISSGRSKFLPLEDQKTNEARTKNRRTEIILTPKLDELFKILGN